VTVLNERVLRTPGDRLSVRVRGRSALVCLGLAALTVAVAVVSLGSGSFDVSPAGVVDVLLGGGTRGQRLAVLEWRMPRAFMAVVAGAALAVSGAIFQAMTRNPLGSPDVIGFATGAYAGAVLSLVIWRDAGPGTPVAALAGGLVTALVVYLLAARNGVEGFRLIIVGIAVSQMLAAATIWLLLKARTETAMAAAVWATGNLGGTTWQQVRDVALPTAVLLLAVAGLSRSLRALSLGDDLARSLGVSVGRAMLLLTLVGVGLTAAVTAHCGLIVFVALAAPQIARRVVRSSGVPLVPTALMGAFLLTVADWVGQHAVPGTSLPVGVVTICVGGGYLVHLLVREARRQ
jgi:iron complex transport system permease protein